MPSNSSHGRTNFEAILSSLAREHRADERVGGAWSAPVWSPFLPAMGERPYGFVAAAEVAFEDLAPAETPATPMRPLPSDAPDAIVSELGLSEIADSETLLRLRRSFMWANHPDRRPDLPRELANRRVAIANMLIDRALIGVRRKRL